MKTKVLSKVFIVVFALVVCSASAQAAQVTLAWDANSVTPDGYRIYARTAAGYGPVPAWQGDGTKTSCTINELADDKQTAFVATAFMRGGIDGSIIESGHSNEVVFTPPGMTPEPPANLIRRLIEALRKAWAQYRIG